MNRRKDQLTIALLGFVLVIGGHAVFAGDGTDFVTLRDNIATFKDDGEGGNVNKIRRLFVLENYGPPQMRFTDTSYSPAAVWQFGHYFANAFRIDSTRASFINGEFVQIVDFALDGRGNVTIPGVVNQSSSREFKQGFDRIDPEWVLARVAELPLMSWSYQYDPENLHLGPIAEDFHATFSLGPDDKHIASSDMAGVALGAIQGLNVVVNEQRQELAELADQNRALMAKIEAVMHANEELAARVAAIEGGGIGRRASSPLLPSHNADRE